MTGPRRLRGRLEDDRHRASERPGPQPIGTHTELEELSVGRITPRGRTRRPGLQAIFAAGGLAVLLAVGFGVFGGRGAPGTSPAAAASTAPVSTGLVVAATPNVTPQVTPWTECGAPPSGPPTVLLELADGAHPATAEVLEWIAGASAPPGPAPTVPPVDPGRIEIVTDDFGVRELFVVGRACASAWTISLSDGTSSEVVAEGGFPGDLQNRFSLPVGPFSGDHELEALLSFPTLTALASWPVRLVATRPTGVLSGRRGSVDAVEGCDVTISSNLRESIQLHDCFGPVERPPSTALRVGQTGALEFGLDGYVIEDGEVSCGLITGSAFMSSTECGPAGADEGTLSFAAPAEAGAWTVAIVACPWRFGFNGPGTMICGTWYANVEVQA